jgi:hypothetical protein
MAPFARSTAIPNDVTRQLEEIGAKDEASAKRELTARYIAAFMVLM